MDLVQWLFAYKCLVEITSGLSNSTNKNLEVIILTNMEGVRKYAVGFGWRSCRDKREIYRGN